MFPRFLRNLDRPPLDRLQPQRICLIKPSALGDIVQALPVLSALRSRFPQSHIAWVVNRSYADLLAGHPHLDELLIFDRGAAGSGWISACNSMRRLCDELVAQRFDLACDLQGLLRSGLMAGATHAARRVGLRDCREGARLFCTDIVPVPADRKSAVDRYWLVAEALGAGSEPKRFVLGLDESDHAWADGRLCELDGLRIGIHAGARWATKRWPAASFAEIARRLERDFAAQMVLVGGPDSAEAAGLIESAVRGHCVNLVGQTSLKQLAAVLGRVNLLFTTDSGPMHLAAAMGTRVAAIFTCTSPERARPHGDGHVVITSKVWCAASYLKRCSRLECMTELTPDLVWPSLAAQLTELGPRAAA
jgi:lipopolysaccharide heptosyltransferase I